MEPFHQFFLHAMKRTLPEIRLMPDGRISSIESKPALVLNLGAGNTHIPGTIDLDLPKWDANKMPIPFDDGTVDAIHAYHFLEHVESPINMLREIQRALKPGGIVQLVVPFYTSRIQAHDLTHKSFWCENTWSNLFRQDYYDHERKGWELQEEFNLIVGQTERNMVLLTQLVRE